MELEGDRTNPGSEITRAGIVSTCPSHQVAVRPGRGGGEAAWVNMDYVSAALMSFSWKQLLPPSFHLIKVLQQIQCHAAPDRWRSSGVAAGGRASCQGSGFYSSVAGLHRIETLLKAPLMGRTLPFALPESCPSSFLVSFSPNTCNSPQRSAAVRQAVPTRQLGMLEKKKDTIFFLSSNRLMHFWTHVEAPCHVGVTGMDSQRRPTWTVEVQVKLSVKGSVLSDTDPLWLLQVLMTHCGVFVFFDDVAGERCRSFIDLAPASEKGKCHCYVFRC